MRCERDLKDNKDNSLHLGRNMLRYYFVLGHYLFLVARSFPRASQSENCSLLGPENVHGQISEHIFVPNGDYYLYVPSPCGLGLSFSRFRFSDQRMSTDKYPSIFLCQMATIIYMYPVPAVWVFHFQDGSDITNPTGLFLFLALEVQKRSNAPVPGQKLATKVSKSRAIPRYVPGVNPPGWPLISALYDTIKMRGWPQPSKGAFL